MRRYLAVIAVVGLAAASLATATAASRSPRAAIDATATPPPAPVTLEVDCDTTAAGVQHDCALPDGAFDLDVDLVVVNHSADPFVLSAFNFILIAPQTLLSPKPGVDGQMNANPDFADFEGGVWACSPPAPSADTDGSPDVARSFLSCFNFDGGATAPFTRSRDAAAGGDRPILGDRGRRWFAGGRREVSVGDQFGNGKVDCFRGDEAACRGATFTVASPPSATATPASPTATPEPWDPPVAPDPIRWSDATPVAEFSHVAVDCAPDISGIQASCEFAPGTDVVVVDIIFVPVVLMDEVSAVSLAVTTDQRVLTPREGHDANLDANPDFADLSGNWRCAPPLPVADDDPSPSVARSRLECLADPGAGPLAAGEPFRIASVYYDASDGAVTVGFESAALGGRTSYECGTILSALRRCGSAFIGIGAAPPVPTATPTATPSATPTRAPRRACISAGQRAAMIDGIFRRAGARIGERRYHARYDVNRDGVIDGWDALAVAGRPLCR